MRFQVNCQVLSGARRAAYQGDILEPADIEGIDTDRLVTLGAIVPLDEPDQEPAAELNLKKLTKSQLVELATELGLQVDPAATNAAMIAEIEQAQAGLTEQQPDEGTDAAGQPDAGGDDSAGNTTEQQPGEPSAAGQTETDQTPGQ